VPSSEIPPEIPAPSSESPPEIAAPPRQGRAKVIVGWSLVAAGVVEAALGVGLVLTNQCDTLSEEYQTCTLTNDLYIADAIIGGGLVLSGLVTAIIGHIQMRASATPAAKEGGTSSSSSGVDEGISKSSRGTVTIDLSHLVLGAQPTRGGAVMGFRLPF
jgi:hypothetical protein